jgi:carboxylesterase type B
MHQKVYTFRNIRYAAPPVGDLRWKKPAPPPKTTEIQDRREALACTQPPSEEVRTVGGAIVGSGHEDCLFLDLTIPRKVFQNPQVKVPVLVWIHGGYYSNFQPITRLYSC